MKVGDYVRTKDGIAKCIKVIPIRENSFMYEFDKEVYEGVNYLTASELEKYKSSPNIIDLIEVGDYVDGVEIDYISEDGVYAEYNNSDYYYFEEEDIESIVTKEQFESMKYKIGE